MRNTRFPQVSGGMNPVPGSAETVQIGLDTRMDDGLAARLASRVGTRAEMGLYSTSAF
jgi:hypothetical protein